MIANANINLGLVITIQNFRADGVVTGKKHTAWQKVPPHLSLSICVCVL